MVTSVKSFRNSTGYWNHKGAFSVELVDGTDTSIVPSSAEIRGNIVFVSKGSVKQTMGGIQLNSAGVDFYWSYSRMKVIRDGKGNLLWVNNNHRG